MTEVENRGLAEFPILMVDACPTLNVPITYQMINQFPFFGQSHPVTGSVLKQEPSL